jgi:hypothetical protein
LVKWWKHWPTGFSKPWKVLFFMNKNITSLVAAYRFSKNIVLQT